MACLVAKGTATELNALVPGAHVRVGLADGSSLELPSDGTAGALRALLADPVLDDDAHVAVVRPDLDDVFFTLTEAAR